MSAASLRLWDSLLSDLSKFKPDMDPAAAAGINVVHVAEAEMIQLILLTASPSSIKAFWKKLVMEKQVYVYAATRSLRAFKGL
jgi:hypothetical protein